MPLYHNELQAISSFVDSVLYSGSMFESFTTDEDKKLFIRGCARYNSDRSGNQCRNDLYQFVHDFVDSVAGKGGGDKARKYLSDMSDINFQQMLDEYDHSSSTEPKIIFMLKRYIQKKIPTINSEIVDVRNRAKKLAGNFVDFVKKEIIKKEAEREREETYSKFKNLGVYDMDSSGSGSTRGDLDKLVAEEGDKYGSKGEADTAKQS